MASEASSGELVNASGAENMNATKSSMNGMVLNIILQLLLKEVKIRRPSPTLNILQNHLSINFFVLKGGATSQFRPESLLSVAPFQAGRAFYIPGSLRDTLIVLLRGQSYPTGLLASPSLQIYAVDTY